MKHRAKASSEGSTQRQAGGLGRTVRRVLATRAPSFGADGSGARPHRARLAAVALAIAALALLALTPLSAARTAIGGFGTGRPPINNTPFPLFGGQIGSNVRGVAVNDSGAGAPKGTLYVISEGRVDRFSPTDAWERAWGWDVIAPFFNETQTLEVNATGGSFRLGFKGVFTDPLPFDAKAGFQGQVVEALQRLSTIGGEVGGFKGNLVDPTGSGPHDCITQACQFQFQNELGKANVPSVTVDTSELEGTAEVTTLVNGVNAGETGGSSTGFEICTVASFCKVPDQSAGPITANGGVMVNAKGIAVNQANGDVYVTDSFMHRVSEFDPDGNFVRAWGWDTIASGEPNDAGAGFEICEVASECRQGSEGANGGELGGELGPPVVDASNNVWVPDSANRRIEEFDQDGNFIAAYGYDVDALGGGGGLEKCASIVPGACQAGAQGSGPGQFGANGPSEIAFDNLGNLYAIDPGNNRVQKLDPTLLASATDFAPSLFSTYTTNAPEHVISTTGGARLIFSLNKNATPPSERQIIEVDPANPSAALDTSLAGVGLSGVNGLGADPTGATLYAMTESFSSPFKVLILGPASPPLELSLNSVSTKTDTTALLSGAVAPKGAWVSDCKFEYSTDQLTWTTVPVSACESFNGEAHAISATVTQLKPNTTYFFRLRASRPLTANSTVTSAPRSFTTVAPPPVVSDVGAVQVADTSARFVATIDPRNTETGYVFQYGTTPALGSSTPPLNIGSGTTPITVSQLVSGLSKDTTYYFRAVATNAIGTTTSANHTLHTRTTPLPLPEDRAYEQVSPADKNFGDANSGLGYDQAGASITGDGVGYCTTTLFGEPPAQMASRCGPHLSRRGQDGWSLDTYPRFCAFDVPAGAEGGGSGFALPADFSHVLLEQPESEHCSIPPLDPAAPLFSDEVTKNFYLQDRSTDPPAYVLVKPHTGGGSVGGSEDFSHVIIASKVNQTAEPDSPEPGNFPKLYDWERQGTGSCVQPDGCLTLLSKNTHNEPFETQSWAPSIDNIGGSPDLLSSAVSRNGDRVYFSNSTLGLETGREETSGTLSSPCEVAGCEIFMREDRATTYDVSASECTVSCGSPQAKADYFLSATPSGAVAFFASCAKLTDESQVGGCVGAFGVSGSPGSGLYRWDHDAPLGHQLVDLTVDHEPGDGSEAGFLGLIGESDDGDTAYFVARGQIAAGQSTASGEKLYRWRYNGGSPTVDYLGPYKTFGDSLGVDHNWYQLSRTVTPDGKYMMIVSKLRLDPAADHDADADVYRWDEADGWICVSCQAPGAPSAGNVDLGNVWFQYVPPSENSLGHGGNGNSIGSLQPRVDISDDGQRIFFGSPDALVSGDVNGEVGCPGSNPTNTFSKFVYQCEDVYEWHGGTVSLISSGTSSDPSRLIGSDPSGRDVFFFTRDRLVGWDQDNGVDIYDARVGGGFPEPPPQPPQCDGAELCHGAGTSAVAAAGAGTAAFEGPGNPAPKHGKKPRKHHGRHHKAHKRDHRRAVNRNRRTGR